MNFADALRIGGLLPRDIEPDGRWHRCPTIDKPRRRNGAYKLTIDGQRGWWRNFATDAECSTWTPDQAVQSPRLDMRRLRAQERARRREALSAMRQHWWSLPKLNGGHPYLDAKGLSIHGCERLRIDGELLTIPMEVEGRLMSLQTIAPDGTKRYRAGCPVGGACFRFARRSATILALTEGFATGLAIHQCCPDAAVIVCFDAGNLVRVASAMNAHGLAVVCADNDWRGSTNTGLEKGRQAAAALGCGIALPQGIRGTDWADALVEVGPAKVRYGVMRGAVYVSG